MFEFNYNNKRALNALKSIILINNNNRFKDKFTVKDFYQIIIIIFKQINLKLISHYFNKIVDINYNSFNNINKYINNIQSLIIYLKELKQFLFKTIII